VKVFQRTTGWIKREKAQKRFTPLAIPLPLGANDPIEPSVSRQIEIEAGIHSRRIGDHYPSVRTYENWLGGQIQAWESSDQFLSPLFHLVRCITMVPNDPQDHPPLRSHYGETEGIGEILIFYNSRFRRKGPQRDTEDLILISGAPAALHKGLRFLGHRLAHPSIDHEDQ